MIHQLEIPTSLTHEFDYASAAGPKGSKRLRVIVTVIPTTTVKYEVSAGGNSAYVTDSIDKAVEAFNAIDK